MNLVDEIQVCEHCERDMEYMGLGEWNCECGKNWYADWLDGPALCDWLDAFLDCSTFKATHPSLCRRTSDWRAGKPANFYSLDGWLVKLGLHTDELPDHLWCERPARKHNPEHTEEVRLKALKRVDGGEQATSVARDFGVTARTLRNWRDKLEVTA